MSKIKRPEREHPFTVIDDRLFKDQRISAKAKAVHAYIYGKPDGWQTSVQHVINTFKEGKTAVYNAVDELVEHGYWKRQQTRKDDGTLGKVNYVIQEVPDGKPASQANETTSGFSGSGSSASGSSGSGSSGSGNQDPKKKDSKSKEGKNKESNTSSSLRSEGQSPPDSAEFGESDEDEAELSNTGESASTRNGQSNDRGEKNFRAAGMMAAMNALENCDGAGEENFVMSLVFRDLFAPGAADNEYIGRVAKLRRQLVGEHIGGEKLGEQDAAEAMVAGLYDLSKRGDFRWADFDDPKRQKQYMDALPDRALNYITKTISNRQDSDEQLTRSERRTRAFQQARKYWDASRKSGGAVR